MTSPTALLAIRGLRAAYGKIEALKGVDLEINAGEIVALIGALIVGDSVRESLRGQALQRLALALLAPGSKRPTPKPMRWPQGSGRPRTIRW